MKKITPFFRDLVADPILFAIAATILAMIAIGVKQMATL